MTAAAVAEVARLCARAELIGAFGHVSMRVDGGFLITPTLPLLRLQPSDVLACDESGEVVRGDPAVCPLETPLHAAIYAARKDVGAVCRTHSPAASAWAARAAAPPLCHGLGGLAGSVRVHSSPQLVVSAEQASAAMADLGEADCLLLAANGCVCAGGDLAAAAVRAWYLEERAAVADRAPGAPELAGSALVERAAHFEAEAARAWRWLRARFGEEPE